MATGLSAASDAGLLGLQAVVVDAGAGPTDDVVAIEEPLEVIVDDVPFVVLMRTPTGTADDLALVAGFLAAEGVIDEPQDLRGLAPCETDSNQVRVRLAAGVSLPPPRPVATNSACGICGARTIDDVLARLARLGPSSPASSSKARATAIQAPARDLADLARPHQALFRATGAVHAAALFRGDALVALKEDVGRHNATDKLLGEALLAGRWPLSDATLWVSGRVAFEIVQKAVVAGITQVVGVGGPTSLAVDLARRTGLRLWAFARGDRANGYS